MLLVDWEKNLEGREWFFVVRFALCLQKAHGEAKKAHDEGLTLPCAFSWHTAKPNAAAPS